MRTSLNIESSRYRDLVKVVNMAPEGDRSNVNYLVSVLKNNIRDIVDIDSDKLDAALWDANPKIYYTPDTSNFIRVNTECIVRVFSMIKHYKS